MEGYARGGSSGGSTANKEGGALRGRANREMLRTGRAPEARAITAGSSVGETMVAGALPHPPEWRQGPGAWSLSCPEAADPLAIVVLHAPFTVQLAARLEQHA